MNKLYVFLTADIHIIGGMQLYTSGKAEYLLDKGWHVKVLYDGNPKDSYQIKFLEQYNKGSFSSLTSDPFAMSSNIRNKIIDKMMNYIGKENEYEEIYVESQSDFTAIWGELLAKRYNCKHICFNCNEQFRGKSKIYDKYIDFFKFKFDRNELFVLHKDSINKLFEGYYNIKDSKLYIFDALEPSPVKDVDSDFVNKLKREDYNIGYIGRTTKGYVPNILESISKFSSKHLDKKIQLIIIGEANEIMDKIENAFKNNTNIVLQTPGNMVPIPKLLFSKLDVIIAGAVCAELSAREGVPTIVADCENYLSNGVLGYTTDNSMYPTDDKQEEFIDTLEDVLITKHYLEKEYSFPKEPSPNEIYQKHLELFNNTDESKDKYSFEENKKESFKKSIRANAKALFPNLYYWFLKKIN